ncbi:MAG: 4Fe-4S dicluster domain-containing protein, partial [Clostridia bacterium]|nr:4Fe-4S dicluster domain-containing protein [Clostridia bacterium]
ECIGCEKCKNVCPAKAITMKKRRPVIDRALCIRCFCCQEFCPVGAMKVRRPAVARLLNHKKK